MSKEKNQMVADGFDPSQTINKAIEVPKYPSQTVDELLPNLSSAKNVSCVDVDKHCAGEEFFIFDNHAYPQCNGGAVGCRCCLV